jgi:hypothetical protein
LIALVVGETYKWDKTLKPTESACIDARKNAVGARMCQRGRRESTMRGGVNVSNHNVGAAAGGGALCGQGMFGSWVFFWQQADTFWARLFAVLQGVVWPAFMIYKGFSALDK